MSIRNAKKILETNATKMRSAEKKLELKVTNNRNRNTNIYIGKMTGQISWDLVTGII